MTITPVAGCDICYMVACGFVGIALIVTGSIFIALPDNRGKGIAEYNAAVEEWNENGRSAFQNQNFTVRNNFENRHFDVSDSVVVLNDQSPSNLSKVPSSDSPPTDAPSDNMGWFTPRSDRDPWIKAMNVTGGDLDFGLSIREKSIIGGSLLGVGLLNLVTVFCFCIPLLIYACSKG
eukprot:gb/GECH01002668.1/.p1 GENE.gb/GECH01002668.1/~~gb/GECH01002668.1/.p1  ORF type:complete len:177 (+),score=40.18 gb/GECH01002668.1/:1-531(+)